MKQCEFYHEVITPQGNVMFNMFASEHLTLDEKNHCPNPAVDYIIVESLGKIYLCAEHYDIVKLDGEVATFSADDDENYELEEFTQ